MDLSWPEWEWVSGYKLHQYRLIEQNVPFIDPDMAKELVRELAAAVGIEYLLSAGEVAESPENKAVVNFG